MQLEPIDYAQLNPGIRRVVAFLRDHGFDTRDSGDGETHEHACDQDVPYVFIAVEPDDLVAEARRLRKLLLKAGVVTHPLDEDGTLACIEATYNPAHPLAVLTLWNVSDRDIN